MISVIGEITSCVIFIFHQLFNIHLNKFIKVDEVKYEEIQISDEYNSNEICKVFIDKHV